MGNVNTMIDDCLVDGSIFASKLNFGGQDGKHNITFIGDSHVTGCASEITQNL